MDEVGLVQTRDEEFRERRASALARRVMTELYGAGDEDLVNETVHAIVMLWLDERVMSADDADAATAVLGELAGKMKAERQLRGLDPTIVDASNGPDGHGVPDGPDAHVPGEYWVQGDCVRIAARDVMHAITQYRQQLADAQIGISQGVHCDALYARKAARGFARMRRVLEALAVGAANPALRELVESTLLNEGRL